MPINHHNLAERLVKAAPEVEKLVEYLWDKELEDFEEQFFSGQEAAVESHIFNSVVKVSNALRDFGDTPKDIINCEDTLK